jgi:hypothetical protein
MKFSASTSVDVVSGVFHMLVILLMGLVRDFWLFVDILKLV